MAKLEDMLVMHCMTNAVLRYKFSCKFHQQTDLEKELIRLISKKLYIYTLYVSYSKQ